MSKVIDFRIRPPYGTYQKFVNLISAPYLTRYGYEYRGSLATKSFDDLIAELDAAGVEKAVVQGRHGLGFYVDNQELFDVVERCPERFIAYPFIDATAPDAVAQIDELIAHGPGAGAALEPGAATADYPAFDFDDERAYPAYDRLQEIGAPILLTVSSLLYDVIDPTVARQIDHVARDFPHLTIVVSHGAWPYVSEIIAVAYKRKNVYIAPDVYATAGFPGAEEYWKAARTILPDQIIFESSYPIAPVDQAIEQVRREWGLDEAALEKVLYGNAARVLGL